MDIDKNKKKGITIDTIDTQKTPGHITQSYLKKMDEFGDAYDYPKLIKMK